MKVNLKEIWKCLNEPSDEMDKLDCLIKKFEGFEQELREEYDDLKGYSILNEPYRTRFGFLKEILGE